MDVLERDPFRFPGVRARRFELSSGLDPYCSESDVSYFAAPVAAAAVAPTVEAGAEGELVELAVCKADMRVTRPPGCAGLYCAALAAVLWRIAGAL